MQYSMVALQLLGFAKTTEVGWMVNAYLVFAVFRNTTLHSMYQGCHALTCHVLGKNCTGPVPRLLYTSPMESGQRFSASRYC